MTSLLLDTHYGPVVRLGRSKFERNGKIASRVTSKSEACQRRELAHNNFELLPISLQHCTMIETLSSHHRDPFDRMLIAQAITENLALVSRDPTFDQHGVTRSW